MDLDLIWICPIADLHTTAGDQSRTSAELLTALCNVRHRSKNRNPVQYMVGISQDCMKASCGVAYFQSDQLCIYEE